MALPLPSAPIVTLSSNASVQPPLSRRGHGPGVIVIDAGLPDSSVEKSLDPKPQKKWAEEGYAVARVTFPSAVEGAWDIESALEKAVDALVKLDTCDTKDKFALIVYGKPSDFPAGFSDKLRAAYKSGASILAAVSFSSEWDLSAKPELVHIAGKPGSPVTRPNTTTYDYAQVASEAFIMPGAADFNYSAASVAHTRGLTFIKKHLGGPNFDLEAIWDEHTYYEFDDRSVEKTMATMVDEPYVNHIPTMTGGVGRERLTTFYRHHFIFSNPEDTALELVSRTIGVDRIVDEFVFTLTHNAKVDWLLPGVPPTGKRLRLPFTSIVNIRGDRLYHEHIAWDQCTALIQAGLMPEYLTFPYPVDGKSPEAGKKFEYRVPAAGFDVPAKLQDHGAAESNGMFSFEVRQVDARLNDPQRLNRIEVLAPTAHGSNAQRCPSVAIRVIRESRVVFISCPCTCFLLALFFFGLFILLYRHASNSKMVGYSRSQVAAAGLALMGGLPALAAQIPLGLDNDHQQQAPLHSDGGALPLVSTEALQDSIKIDNLYARAKELYEIAKLGEEEYNHPTRVIGGDGHLGTLSYIYSSLAELGDYYTLSNQSFPAVTGRVTEYRLVLGDQVPSSALSMGLTPPTKDKEPVHGDVVLVANSGCDTSDFPAEVAGNIAFVKRGSCTFGTKSENAGRAGAVAAVVYNNDEGPLSGTLGTPSPYHVATFGVSDTDAAPVLKKLKGGKHVDAIAYMDADVSIIHTDNIIAQTTAGDPDNCVMLGGHSDSVTEGPGINDDGSGSLSVLEVAKQLTKFDVNNCVRFSWWAGEEEGLLGSDYYAGTLTPEENQKIRLFMDYDMMASPNFAYQIYNATNDASPEGSEELRDLYINWYKSQNLSYTLIPFDGRSDYDGFIRAGIPAGGIATGAEGIKTKEEEKQFGGKAGDWYDPCYHQLCDDVSNLNLTAWEVNTKLIAHSVATYAASFEGFPKRAVVKSSSAGVYGEQTKYHGSKLFI